MPERLTLDDIDQWLLSGKPVVRLQGRDFGQDKHEYATYIEQMCVTLRLGVVTQVILDPPGVVVQTYLESEDPPVLEVPLLKINKAETPWLFCVYPKCRNRVSVPGSECGAH